MVKMSDIHGPLDERIRKFVRVEAWEPGLLFWMFWDENARKYPTKEALADSRWRLTWAEAREQAVKLALGFKRLGFNKDDILLAQLPNSVEAMLLRDAMERIGVVYFHVATGFRHKEMKHLLGTSEATAVVVPGLGRFEESFDFVEMIREIKAELPRLKYIFTVGQAPQESLALSDIMETGAGEKVPKDYFRQTTLNYDECVAFRATSGSTGMPKISCCSSPLRNSKDFVDRWKVTKDDVILALAPIATGAGLPAVELSGFTGCKAVMQERWDPKTGPERALSLIEKENVTIACGVPPHILMIAEHPHRKKYNLSSLRLFSWAGAPLAKEAVEGLEKNLGCKLLPYYGTMDSGWISGTYYDDPIEVRSSTVGRPGSQWEIKLIDEKGHTLPPGEIGELLVRGGSGTMGYLKEPDLVSATWDSEGWYNTKDLAQIDEQGNIHLMGRRSDMINRGGQNVYPMEIEKILAAHPKVAQACIVPMPDPVLGQRACAYVEPKPGAVFTFDEMIAWLEKEKMAKYKRPERLEVRDRLPLLSSGKIDKMSLMEDIRKKIKEEA